MEGGLELRELTGLPSELVLALGEVTARYGQIEHILTMTIKRTAKPPISWADAFEHVKKLGRKDTRKKVKDFFEQGAISEFGETEGARRSKQFNELLDVWFDKDGGLADRRDDVVHSCWSIKEGHVTNTRKGTLLLNVDGRPFGIKDVENLANDLTQFLFHLNSATMLSSVKGKYLFEETHWWATQTARLADQWLDSLFGDKRTYEIDDWSRLYQTNLNILGLPTEDNLQECAVLSRLIYGLSAAYLILGDERYRKAAEAAVRFQRDAFRSLSHDSQYCFWAFGRRRGKYGTELLVPSESGDDKGSIPLYEQIYALAGLANYYRISLDWAVLEDIRRTMRAFNDFFLDEKRDGDTAFRGDDGYFSHIDYSTMRPELNANTANNLKKNWNSVGDHIPAYLVNLLLASSAGRPRRCQRVFRHCPGTAGEGDDAHP